MDPSHVSRLKEIESLTFDNPRRAKEFLRILKKEEPTVYKALILLYEESSKPKEVDGCLQGERFWGVKVTSEGFRLSSSGSSLWPVYEPLEAKCNYKTHPAPADDCDCGIYAVLPGNGNEWVHEGLLGTVALWGRFLEGSKRVYKAQFAYPQTFDCIFCSQCHKQKDISNCYAFLTRESNGFNGSLDGLTFKCKEHTRTEGPLVNLYVPATYVVDELRKEYGLEQLEASETVESFIETLNLEGF